MRSHDFTLGVAAVQSRPRSLTGLEAGGRLINAQLDLRKCVRNFSFFATIDHDAVPCRAPCVNSIDCDHRPRMSWGPFKVEFAGRSPLHRIAEIKQSKHSVESMANTRERLLLPLPPPSSNPRPFPQPENRPLVFGG